MILLTKKSTSSNVFSLPKDTLSALFARLLSSPIAVSTCDGSASPVLHAEPAEAHIPLSSSFKRSCPASIPLKEKFAFPASLFSLSPFKIAFGIFSSICFM